MRVIESHRKTEKYCSEIVCDSCGKRVSTQDVDDMFELQEMLHIEFVGGYNSVFGDEVRVMGDFCQNCVKSLLGQYLIRTVNDDN